MALDRSQIKVPALPKKTLPCGFLGGEVIVRGLTLAEHLANAVRQQAERAPRVGETEDEAKARTNGLMGLRIAAQAVVDPQGQPLLTLDEWEALSAAHPQQVYDFLAEVSKVALGVEDAAKN